MEVLVVNRGVDVTLDARHADPDDKFFLRWNAPAHDTRLSPLQHYLDEFPVQLGCARAVELAEARLEGLPFLGSSGIKFEVEGGEGSAGADTYIPASFLLHFSQKLRFCSIFLRFSENAAFWENPEKF